MSNQPPNERDNLIQVETGVQPTAVAMPANTAREGVSVTRGEPTPASHGLDQSALAATTQSESHPIEGVHSLTAPKHATGSEASVEKLTTSLGGMMVTAPLAALEKVSPKLAHGVEAVGSSLVDMAHALTGTGPQYTSSEPIIETPTAQDVQSTLASTAKKVQDTVQPALSSAVESAKPAVASVAQTVGDNVQQAGNTVQQAGNSAAQQVKESVPVSSGDEKTAASEQLIHPSTRETGVDLSMEPAGARKQVHPVSTGSAATAAHSTTSESQTVAGVPHTYLETAVNSVRQAGSYISQVLPGPEKQHEISETAAQALERAPHVASSAAQSTATGLTSAARTTAEVAGPAASSAASMAVSAAQTVAGTVQSAASTVTGAIAGTAQRAAATAHLPGWKAPVPSETEEQTTGTASPSAPTAGRGFASPPEPATPLDEVGASPSPMGGSSAVSTGEQADVIKDYLRPDQGAVGSATPAETGERDLAGLTETSDPSMRGMDQAEGLDLRRTHDEPALDQQVSTHDPDAHLASFTASNPTALPVFSPELATRAHSDTDVDRPTHPGISSIPTSESVGTATILSHETIGGPAGYGESGSSAAASAFEQPSFETQSSSSQARTGYERFAPTSSQSSGGQDARVEGQTSSFMPHSSTPAGPVYGQSSETSHRLPKPDESNTSSSFADTPGAWQNVMSGAGSPRTYSATHPDSEPKSTRDDHYGSDSMSSQDGLANRHPDFVPVVDASSASQSANAFDAFNKGQPHVAGLTSLDAVGHGRSDHLSSAQARRGDSDPFQPDVSATSRAQPSVHHQHESTTASAQESKVGTLKYTDPFADSPGQSAPSFAPRRTPRGSAASNSATDRDAPISAENPGNHGTTSNMGHDGSAAAAGTYRPSEHEASATSPTTAASSGVNVQGTRDHKPSLKERIKGTLHHSSH